MAITKNEISSYKIAKLYLSDFQQDIKNPLFSYSKQGDLVFEMQSEVAPKYMSKYYDVWVENGKTHIENQKTGAKILFSGAIFNSDSLLKALNKSGLQTPKWFDPMDYLMANKDLFDNLVDPVEHYLNAGIKEGRDPSPFFSEQKYLELNIDIKQGVEKGHLVSGYMHYMEHGCREGRSPDGIFNEQKYLELNNDIYQGIQKGHLQCGFIHCIQYGLEEGRLGCADIYPVE